MALGATGNRAVRVASALTNRRYCGISFQQRINAIDKVFSGVDGRDGLRERHGRIEADFVIGEGFEVVGLRQKVRQFAAKARFVPREAGKLRMNAAMRFWHLAAALEDQGLRGVKRRETGSAAGSFGKREPGDRTRFAQRLSGFIQVTRRFRFHNSTPSRRISCISGVRS